MKSRKFLYISLKLIVIAFAAAGAFFVFSYLAIQLKLTRDPGIADPNSRYFSQMRDRYNQGFASVADSSQSIDFSAYERLVLLNRFYPQNARNIEKALRSGTALHEISRMLDEADVCLQADSAYLAKRQSLASFFVNSGSAAAGSVFVWMNIAEWQDFKIAVGKDRRLIDSAAALCGLEPRLLVACLVGEQIRLFNSGREAYKKWIGPLKILSVESQFSFGVTGIKEATAIQIERNLLDSSSVFYPGKPFRNLLAFSSPDSAAVRIKRLTSYRNHFYSYLYAGLFLRQVMTQWESAGHSIRNRPEILATLFNIGFANSRPKPEPEVGGALIKIKDKEYTFGVIASQFYYSGELLELFPYREKKFL